MILSIRFLAIALFAMTAMFSVSARAEDAAAPSSVEVAPSIPADEGDAPAGDQDVYPGDSSGAQQSDGIQSEAMPAVLPPADVPPPPLAPDTSESDPAAE